MREFSKITCRVWQSRKFKQLDDDGKLLYMYFLTSVHSNSAGFYSIPLGYIIADLKWDLEKIKKGIERVSQTLLIAFNFDEETVFVKNWLKNNQPANPNHCQKIFDDIQQMPGIPEKSLCLMELKDFMEEKAWPMNDEMTLILKGYRKGIERVSPPDHTRPHQTETIQRQDQTKGCGFSKLNGDLVSAVENGDKSANRQNIMKILDERALKNAKAAAPGWDIYYLMNIYDEWSAGKEMPSNPAGAFIGWVKNFTKGKSP